jgi:hypothetical protein
MADNNEITIGPNDGDYAYITVPEKEFIPPDVLLERLLAGADGEAAKSERYGVLWDIFRDVRDSYLLAMTATGVSQETIHEVEVTVLDYLVNNYGED